MQNMAAVYYAQHLFDQAEPLFRQAYEGYRRSLGAGNRHTLSAMRGLVAILTELERFDEAEPLAVECFELHSNSRGADHGTTYKALGLVVGLYDAWEKPDKASNWRSKLPDSHEARETYVP